MGRSRYRFFENDCPYFITCTVVSSLPLFSQPVCAKIVLESLGYLQARRRLTPYAYVLTANHLLLQAAVLRDRHL